MSKNNKCADTVVTDAEPKMRYDKEKAKVWGSPDYLLARYDDVQSAKELSKKCKATNEVKAAVKAIATKKDNMQVHSVIRTVVGFPGEKARDGIVAQVGVGLNGTGRQADYLAALARLVKSGEFSIFDAYVDAVDDLATVLVSYKPVKSGKSGKSCKSGKTCTKVA